MSNPSPTFSPLVLVPPVSSPVMMCQEANSYFLPQYCQRLNIPNPQFSISEQLTPTVIQHLIPPKQPENGIRTENIHHSVIVKLEKQQRNFCSKNCGQDILTQTVGQSMVTPGLNDMPERSTNGQQKNIAATSKPTEAAFAVPAPVDKSHLSPGVDLSKPNKVVPNWQLPTSKASSLLTNTGANLGNENQPRKARLKISPRLPAKEKEMWMSGLGKLNDRQALLPKPDSNNRWDLLKFRKCEVSLTKLPEEITEIYFAKAKPKSNTKPLVYIVPTPRDANRKMSKLVFPMEPSSLICAENIKKEVCTENIKKEVNNDSGAPAPVAPIPKLIVRKKPKIRIKVGKKQLLKSMEDMKQKEKKKKKKLKKRCPFCAKLKKKSDLVKHRKAAYSIVKIKEKQISELQVRSSCSICQTPICSQIALKLHIDHLHSPEAEKVSCFICQDQFNSSALLAFHLQIHYKQQQAAEEGKTPKKSSGLPNTALSSILKIKSNSYLLKAAKCNTCGKIFKRKSLLKLHKAIHNEERMVTESQPLSANSTAARVLPIIVSKAMSSASASISRVLPNITLSVSQVKDPKLLYSALDSASNSSGSTLPINQDRFVNDLPAKCNDCHVSFYSEKALAQHIRSHDMTEVCSICRKTFFGMKQFNMHWKAYHHHHKSTNTDSSSFVVHPVTDQAGRIDENIEASVVAELQSMLMNFSQNNLNTGDHTYNRTDLPPMWSGSMFTPTECPLCDAIITCSQQVGDHLKSFHRVSPNRLSKLV